MDKSNVEVLIKVSRMYQKMQSSKSGPIPTVNNVNTGNNGKKVKRVTLYRAAMFIKIKQLFRNLS